MVVKVKIEAKVKLEAGLHTPWDGTKALDLIKAISPSDTILALKIAIAYRKHIPQQNTYPTIYAKLIPLIPNMTINNASERGLVSLLEWWKDNLPEPIKAVRDNPGRTMQCHRPDDIGYTRDAIDGASANGHIHALKWWNDNSSSNDAGHKPKTSVVNQENRPMKFLFSVRAFERASANGHFETLAWWKSVYKCCRCSNTSLYEASVRRDIPILDFWAGSNNVAKRYNAATEKYDDQSGSANMKRLIDETSQHGYTDIMQWWIEKGAKMHYSTEAMDQASGEGHVGTLTWWQNSGLLLKYTALAMTLASGSGHSEVLEWWKCSGQPLKYEKHAIHNATEMNKSASLQWWKDSGLGLKFDVAIVDLAGASGHVEALDWWHQSGLKVVHSEKGIRMAKANGHDHVVRWYKANGIELDALPAKRKRR